MSRFVFLARIDFIHFIHPEQDCDGEKLWRSNWRRIQVNFQLSSVMLFLRRCFDRKGTGTIPRSDAQMLFEVSRQFPGNDFVWNWFFWVQNLGESLKDEEIEGLLDEGDLEGDGSISYMDFCAIKNLMWKPMSKIYIWKPPDCQSVKETSLLQMQNNWFIFKTTSAQL